MIGRRTWEENCKSRSAWGVLDPDRWATGVTAATRDVEACTVQVQCVVGMKPFATRVGFTVGKLENICKLSSRTYTPGARAFVYCNASGALRERMRWDCAVHARKTRHKHLPR